MGILLLLHSVTNSDPFREVLPVTRRKPISPFHLCSLHVRHTCKQLRYALHVSPQRVSYSSAFFLIAPCRSSALLLFSFACDDVGVRAVGGRWGAASRKYSSNQWLKQLSYLFLSGVHGGCRDSIGRKAGIVSKGKTNSCWRPFLVFVTNNVMLDLHETCMASQKYDYFRKGR